jgi:hypothetical protein
MILRSRKSRPTTARSAQGATGFNKRSLLGGLIRAAFSGRSRWSVVAALALSLAAPELEPTADAAEPRRAPSNSSLKWRPATSRTAQAEPVRQAEPQAEPVPQTEPAPRADEGPGLLDADQSARPLSSGEADETAAVSTAGYEKPATAAAPPWPRRDNSIRLAQATQPLTNPTLDPFGDDLKRLGTPQQGAPATAQPVPGTTRQQAPRAFEPSTPSAAPAPLPSTGQLAVGGGGFLEERCPELSEMKKISAITNNVTAQPGELPRECFFDNRVLSPSNRDWMMTTYMWKASGLCHKPLYFEQVALERYGHSTGRFSQPFVDGAHFFLTVPILPYKMGIEAPWECKYALGYYRPGSCAPYIIPPLPLSARGAVLEAATAAALVYTLP